MYGGGRSESDLGAFLVGRLGVETLTTKVGLPPVAHLGVTEVLGATTRMANVRSAYELASRREPLPVAVSAALDVLVAAARRKPLDPDPGPQDPPQEGPE